jgi:hypothetical protein
MPVKPGIGTFSQYSTFVGDVFGLSSIYELQVLNIEQKNFANWKEYSTYGYYTGGGSGSGPTFSIIDRLDFSSETVTTPTSKLSQQRQLLSATSSTSYGYFGAGSTPGFLFISSIERLDFSSETVSTLVSRLSTSKSSLSATSSSSYGYFGGGEIPAATTPGTAAISTIDRLDFSTETISVPTPKLVQRRKLSATSNVSTSYGYFGGGSDPLSGGGINYYSTIERLDFSNETISILTSKLPQQKDSLSATSSGSYGYFGGGNDPLSLGVSTIDRLDFLTETTSVARQRLSSTTRLGISATSSGSYGYFGGGYFTSGSRSIINRLDFSNETVTTPTSTLSISVSNSAAVSGGQSILRGNKTYGYIGGGSGASNTINRLDLSTEVVTTLTSKLSGVRQSLSATSSSFYGYFGGGTSGFIPGGENSTVDRLDFSNETVTTTSSTLSQARDGLAAVSSSSYGYFGGGKFEPSSKFSIINRLDFSSETISTPSSKLSIEKDNLAATSSSSYGYFGGGEFANGNTVCTIERLDFSTEIVSKPNRNLSIERRVMAVTGNSSYGWFGGGATISIPTSRLSTIDRIDFSTETVTTPTTKLSQEKSLTGGTSSSSYGYFAGGFTPISTYLSTIDRIDFSTETITTPISTLSEGSTNSAGVSNSN